VSDRYVIALSTAVVLVLAGRFALSFLPLAQWAEPVTVTEAVLFGVGVAGLALHCGAMFFPATVRALPGGPQVIRTVDPLGTASILWFTVAAILVMVGLRRQHVVVWTITALSMASVGYTMYDGGRLHVHLTAIFVAVVLLAAILAVLVIPPWRHRAGFGDAQNPGLPAG
jgi:hypothetical protein